MRVWRTPPTYLLLSTTENCVALACGLVLRACVRMALSHRKNIRSKVQARWLNFNEIGNYNYLKPAIFLQLRIAANYDYDEIGDLRYVIFTAEDSAAPWYRRLDLVVLVNHALFGRSEDDFDSPSVAAIALDV